MPPEISYSPLYYYKRPNLTVNEIIIPSHRKVWIEQTQYVTRYAHRGFPVVIKDNLEAHIYRATKWALSLPHLPKEDVDMIANMMMVHDVGEIGKATDLTVVDKGLDPEEARRVFADEEQTAKRLLTSDDLSLWQEYETGKPFLEGKRDPKLFPVNFNAIVAKLVDVAENESYFHYWYLYLKKIHGDKVYGIFPPEAFHLTFPRLRLYQKNIPQLNLPSAHLAVIEELCAEIEDFGRVADQIEE